jgi:hypothetical protein
MFSENAPLAFASLPVLYSLKYARNHASVSCTAGIKDEETELNEKQLGIPDWGERRCLRRPLQAPQSPHHPPTMHQTPGARNCICVESRDTVFCNLPLPDKLKYKNDD